MVKNYISHSEPPVFDEGWWAAVLAEDEKFGGAQQVPPGAMKAEDRSKPGPDWERATQLYQQDQIIAVTVTSHNRGGLLVEGEGLNGFVPCSHLVDMPILAEVDRRDDCLLAYVGRTLKVKIIECVPDEGRMVFSERAARAEAGKRMILFSSLQPGQRVSGEVTNVTDFGVFIDLGGVEGLIHISELSWGRVNHPSDILQVGKSVEVLVLEVAPERCRVALSLKRLFPNPWVDAAERYPVNAVVPAVITAIVPFGAFARLEEGLEGLIHTSEIPLPADSTPKEFLAPGQNVQVRILQVEVTRQRLGLSMRIDG